MAARISALRDSIVLRFFPLASVPVFSRHHVELYWWEKELRNMCKVGVVIDSKGALEKVN